MHRGPYSIDSIVSVKVSGYAHYGSGMPEAGGRGRVPSSDFGRSINPISTRGTDYPHLITTGTPRFSNLLTALI